MIHEPRNIKDRVAVGDDIFIIEELDEGRVRLIPDPTHILEAGTPIDKALLQPIEDALGAITQKLSGIDEGANRIPAGLIDMWSGSVANVPSGWALCDGSNGTPDLRDRFIVGAGGSYNVGNTGGMKEVTLTSSQLPSHNHGASISTSGGHTHTGTTSTNSTGDYGKPGNLYLMTEVTSPGSYNMGAGDETSPWAAVRSINPSAISTAHSHTFTTSSSGSHSHSITISDTGGGQAHENRPPYYALCFIMKL